MLTTNGSSKILMMSVITIHCKEKCCKDIDVSGSILLKMKSLQFNLSVPVIQINISPTNYELKSKMMLARQTGLSLYQHSKCIKGEYDVKKYKFVNTFVTVDFVKCKCLKKWILSQQFGCFKENTFVPLGSTKLICSRVNIFSK